jgi:hypothetical protein
MQDGTILRLGPAQQEVPGLSAPALFPAFVHYHIFKNFQRTRNFVQGLYGLIPLAESGKPSPLASESGLLRSSGGPPDRDYDPAAGLASQNSSCRRSR